MAKELQISELHGDIHKLHCIPCLPQGTQAKPKQGHKESSLESKISGLGRRYALTVNLFIHHSEFKTTSIDYIPENCFGSHLQEGNFRELLDWLADEWRDIFWVNRSLFIKEVCFLVFWYIECDRADFYQFMRGISSIWWGFTHHSIKQGLPNIFPFYSPQKGQPLHEYEQAHKLLRLDVRDKCMAFCPLIFPNGDITGNQHFMLWSDYLLHVSIV